MRILLINSVCGAGSTGKIVRGLYDYYIKKGHAAAVAYGRGADFREENILRFSPVWEVWLHAGLTRLTGLTGVYSPLATRRLLRFIDEFRPDIIHLHELHAYFINVIAILEYLKRLKIMVVWTFHCEFMYTGKCAHASGCPNWQKGCGACPRLREYPASWFFDWTAAMFRAKKRVMEGFESLVIVSPSRWLAGRIRQSFFQNFPVEVIPNGIDTEIFRPRAVPAPLSESRLEGRRIILAVAPGLMSNRKGGRWVLDLAHRLLDRPYKFILVGVEDTSQSFPENVMALGYVASQSELAAYYSLAEVTLLVSEKETFSMVCAESLCCGTPIVGFESGAPPEVAPAGYGRFVPYGDLEALEKAVVGIISGREPLSSPEACHDFGRGRYARETMAGKYLELYEKMLMKAGPVS